MVRDFILSLWGSHVMEDTEQTERRRWMKRESVCAVTGAWHCVSLYALLCRNKFVSKRECLTFHIYCISVRFQKGGRDITDDMMTFSTIMPSWHPHSGSNAAGRNAEPVSNPPRFLLDVQDTHLTSERNVWEKACVLKSMAMKRCQTRWEMHLLSRAAQVYVIHHF